jgi:hypothetical protein
LPNGIPKIPTPSCGEIYKKAEIRRNVDIVSISKIWPTLRSAVIFSSLKNAIRRGLSRASAAAANPFGENFPN